MPIGTDKEIFQMFQKAKKEIKRERGRPKVDRETLYELIQAGYSTKRITKALGISSKTVRRAKKEMEKLGIESSLLAPEEKEELKEKLDKELEAGEEEAEKAALDFDAECKKVMGYSFKEWLKGKTVAYTDVFNFCERVYHDIWGSPILIFMRDYKKPFADQLASRFIEVYGEDKERRRSRKKKMRQFFTFFGRGDVNNRFLTMTKHRDPISKRLIPEIEMLDFPDKLDRAFSLVEEEVGENGLLLLRIKLITLMRTGSRKSQKDIWGWRKGGRYDSSIIMRSEDDFRVTILSKFNETWDVIWIPKLVRMDLWRLYNERKEGDYMFDDTGAFRIQKFRDAFTKATKDVGLPPLHLHDLRKVGITWMWVMGIALETAAIINIGWKDLNTVKEFYLHYKKLLTRTKKLAYREAIPEWYGEGLEEYREW